MLVSIAMFTVISLYLWAPELGGWQGQSGYCCSDSSTVQSVVGLPRRVVPAESPELRSQGVCPFGSVLLGHECAHEMPGILLKMQILIEWV